MNTVSAKKRFSGPLPKMAAVAFVFWGLSSSSQPDAAPASWRLLAEAPIPQMAPEEEKRASGALSTIRPLEETYHVLSSQDAFLYRAAFSAQEDEDWARANEALTRVRDKGLVGHVLADRYLRRGLTLPEAKHWFSSYSSLPQAPLLYAQAKELKDFTQTSVQRPETSATWKGGGGFGPLSTGFSYSANDNEKLLGKGNKVVSDIRTALRRGNPDRAYEILASGLNQGAISIEKIGGTLSQIAAAFYYQGKTDRARKLARLTSEARVPLGLWIGGLSSWKQDDFSTSARYFSALAQVPALSSWNRAAAAYWAHRAADRSGNAAQSRYWLVKASAFPETFYGAIASSQMDGLPKHSWASPKADRKALELLAHHPAGWRALALAQVGQDSLAEGELRRTLSSTSSRGVRKAALALAEKAGMASLTLQLSGVSVHNNGKPFNSALYPLPAWQPAQGFKVDRALIYAIAHQESLFNPKAVSSRGACGLMQIMPKTAVHIDKNLLIGRVANSKCLDQRLFDPETNLDLGQKYVRILSQNPMIRDNMFFLLAAYNAGPGNLARWVDARSHADPLLFIESVPIQETRDYVQKVFLRYVMYRSRLSLPNGPAIQKLVQGEWPRVALNDNGKIRRAEVHGMKIADATPVRVTR